MTPKKKTCPVKKRRQAKRDPDAQHDHLVLGKALREMRDDLGLTQEALADRMGVYSTFVGRVERGERGVRWHTVRKFLVGLEVEPSEFGAAIERQEKAMARRGRTPR